MPLPPVGPPRHLAGASTAESFWFRLALATAALAYLGLFSAQLIVHGGWPTPDFLIPPLLLLAIAAKRGWSFLVDWFPLLALVLVYEGFRGIADNLNHRVHYASLIHADEWFFGNGNAGPNALQSLLYHAGRVSWYDWAACAAYSAHYVLPVVIGFALWLKSRKLYWRFALSFLVLFLSGFVSFYLYPAAPPWMASEQSLIPPVQRVLVDTLSTLPATQPFALAYQRFSPNMVAAMPSLHAASPMLLGLIAVRVWGKKAIPLLLYPFVAGLAWVYMGEHYFIDVLIGWLCGIAAFVLVWGLAFPRVVPAIEAAGRFLVPAGLRAARPLPAWPLAVLALAVMAYVWIDPLIRPPLPQPIWVSASPGDEQPAAATEGPSAPAVFFSPQPCGSSEPSNSLLDHLMTPLSSPYSAFLMALNGDACLALGANANIPPPAFSELLRRQSDEDMAGSATVMNLPDDEPGSLTVVLAGLPSDLLVRVAPVDPGAKYAVVFRTGVTENPDEVIQAAQSVGEALLVP